MRISTRNRLLLPTPIELKRLSQSIALLDAILMPDWEGRYYSFNSQWGPDEMMGSMRNGSGDEYFILFMGPSAIMKGFAHESDMAHFCVDHNKPWPGVLDQVPPEFSTFLEEPTFSMQDTTFCIWWLNRGPGWQIGNINFPGAPDPDGSDDLLSILDDDPQTYCAWAEEYYEVKISLPLVEHFYRHQPLREDLVLKLNPNVTLDELTEDIAEIGYPFTE